MAGIKSSEGKKMTVQYLCLSCEHVFREITFDKEEYEEELICPYCKGRVVDKEKLANHLGPMQLKYYLQEVFGTDDTSSNNKTNLSVNMDLTESIKGLKAIQREARKATAELRKYSNTVKRTCPQCKTISLELNVVTADNQLYQTHRQCNHCDYKDVIEHD